MSLRGLKVPSIVCPVCQAGIETIDHLFFSCPIASAIVSKIQVWLGFPVFGLYSYQDWLNWLGELKIRRETKDYLEDVKEAILMFGNYNKDHHEVSTNGSSSEGGNTNSSTNNSYLLNDDINNKDKRSFSVEGYVIPQTYKRWDGEIGAENTRKGLKVAEVLIVGYEHVVMNCGSAGN
nr:RNA-directed DNA polymerase, eukaryota [Tanacetum cinerariifolium]